MSSRWAASTSASSPCSVFPDPEKGADRPCGPEKHRRGSSSPRRMGPSVPGPPARSSQPLAIPSRFPASVPISMFNQLRKKSLARLRSVKSCWEGRGNIFHWRCFVTSPRRASCRSPARSSARPSRAGIYVCSLTSAARLSMPSDEFRASITSLKVGEKFDPRGLVDTLVRGGYERTGQTCQVGEFSVRGSLIDIFSPALQYPVRLDSYRWRCVYL